jgi:hypothetical protein
MTILSEKQIEEFRDLRIVNLERIKGVGKPSLERLKEFERSLEKGEFEGGLPFYVAYKYHVAGRYMNQLAKELKLNMRYLNILFRYYGIPTLNYSETLSRRNRLENRRGIIPEKDVPLDEKDVAETEDYRDIVGRAFERGINPKTMWITLETALEQEGYFDPNISEDNDFF